MMQQMCDCVYTREKMVIVRAVTALFSASLLPIHIPFLGGNYLLETGTQTPGTLIGI